MDDLGMSRADGHIIYFSNTIDFVLTCIGISTHDEDIKPEG